MGEACCHAPELEIAQIYLSVYDTQVGQWVTRSKGISNEDPVGTQLANRRTKTAITTLYTTRGHRAVERHHSIRARNYSMCHVGVRRLVGSVTYFGHITTGRPNLTTVGNRSKGATTSL